MLWPCLQPCCILLKAFLVILAATKSLSPLSTPLTRAMLTPLAGSLSLCCQCHLEMVEWQWGEGKTEGRKAYRRENEGD